MVTATRRFAMDAVPPTPRSAATARTSAATSTTSFAQQLAISLESYLQGTSGGANLEISIAPQTGSDVGLRQFVVTVRNAGTPVPAAAPSSTPSAVTTAAEPQAFTDEADAYWAMHPPEVQVLRTIRDEDERTQVAWDLARKGFTIDPHIMVYGLDPYGTMKVRLEEGYTWVPALGQGSNMNRPGFNFPGLAPYDPFNPPRGSVSVSIDFAKGLEHTSPGNAGMRQVNS